MSENLYDNVLRHYIHLDIIINKLSVFEYYQWKIVQGITLFSKLDYFKGSVQIKISLGYSISSELRRRVRTYKSASWNGW